MNTNNTERKVKTIITATDKIGRTESITLMLKVSTAKRLEQASLIEDLSDDYDLRTELSRMEDDTKERMSMPTYYAGYLSPSQYRRLLDFETLIYNKFYNYKLTIIVKW